MLPAIFIAFSLLRLVLIGLAVKVTNALGLGDVIIPWQVGAGCRATASTPGRPCTGLALWDWGGRCAWGCLGRVHAHWQECGGLCGMSMQGKAGGWRRDGEGAEAVAGGAAVHACAPSWQAACATHSASLGLVAGHPLPSRCPTCCLLTAAGERQPNFVCSSNLSYSVPAQGVRLVWVGVGRFLCAPLTLRAQPCAHVVHVLCHSGREATSMLSSNPACSIHALH